MFNKKVAALGAVTAILLAACGDDDDESSDASVANSEAAPADTTATTEYRRWLHRRGVMVHVPGGALRTP